MNIREFEVGIPLKGVPASILAESPHHAELACALRAARDAGRAVLRHYGTTVNELKEGGSPVTAADLDSAEVIIERIRTTFPSDAILCEETADDPSRHAARRLWIVDPLDGTKEFLARNGEFSVMIGLVVDGNPVVGVVYQPAAERLYFACAGGGSWLAERDRVQRLRVSGVNSTVRILTSRSHADATVEALCSALGPVERRPSGSAGIKCSLIASGESDLYAHPVPFMGEWDTCAPEVILREAGGTVTDCRGEPLKYNKREPRQPHGILACTGGLLPRVLPIVQDVVARKYPTG